MHVVDVWMQHPTRRFQERPFFESLRLGDDAKQAFLSGNARRVFKLGAAGRAG
jgi:hypothetical protein